MPTPFVIKDAKSFYSIIKGNPLYGEIADGDAIAALDEYFQQRHKAARADNLNGTILERYMFFQGMLAGCLVQAKIFRHHIAAEAYNQNIDPTTGEKMGDASREN